MEVKWLIWSAISSPVKFSQSCSNMPGELFQLIVLVSWIFSVAFSIPMFLIATFDNKKQFRVWNWPQKWMSKAYSVAWLLVVVLPLIVMAGLYCNVVSTLWFKPLSRQQRVRVKKLVSRSFISAHFNQWSPFFALC